MSPAKIDLVVLSPGPGRPADFDMTATLPLWAVQFHPESIMTLDQQVGLRLVGNIVEYMAGQSLQARTS